jgi:aspartyl-tRNA synthetase
MIAAGRSLSRHFAQISTFRTDLIGKLPRISRRVLSSLSLEDEISVKSHEVLKLRGEHMSAEKELEALKAKLINQNSSGNAIHQPESTKVWGPQVSYYDVETNTELEYGDYETIRSQESSARRYVQAKDIGTSNGPQDGEVVWIRGRIASVRAKGNSAFIVIRSDAFTTVQACHFKEKAEDTATSSKELLKFVSEIALESIVDICGVVFPATVKSCTQKNAEIHIKKIFTVSRSKTVLPFLLEDAAHSQQEIDDSAGSDRPLTGVSSDIRLNNRWLDLRVPANNAIMRIRGGVCMLFRESLTNQGFTEINTPKLIGGESEGGANAFRLNYFGRDACLAQSPQLYKQMAIASDMNRVFEIGPVFRAENSNTKRHLCEFTGLDLEMTINSHYNETLEVVHETFRFIFDGLEMLYAKELSIIREQYPSEPVVFTDKPCIIHWDEGMQMLQDAGEDIDVYDDMNTALEIKLGQLVKEKYHTDFFMLDQYPAAIRPFYTMKSPLNPLFTNSYDMFIRGQEICSGAQRCHEPNELEEQIKEKGMSLESLKYYVESFRHGISPHAGAGIGLDRVVFLYLGLDNVRKGTMFPRDPSRIVP